MRLLEIAAVIFAGVLICLHAEPVKAQADTGNGGNFGAGIMIGEPSGFSVKYWNSPRTAFNIGTAWSVATGDESIHLHADYLFHSWFADVDRRMLGFYYGIGSRVIFADRSKIGIRFPIGLNYVFRNIPFDIFLEAAPILGVSPEFGLAGNGAFGVRYYF